MAKDGDFIATNFSVFGDQKTILLHGDDGHESQALLAICNALLLREKSVIDNPMSDEWELKSFLENKLEALCPEALKERLGDAVSKTHILDEYSPKPVWNRIDSFKENSCSEIFQVLQMGLYHGWIIDDQNVEAKCFHEIRQSGLSPLESIMIERNGDFTEKGLSDILEILQNQEICVLLQHGSFHTATKSRNEIYLLVTEKNRNEQGMMWRTLDGSLLGEDITDVSMEITSEAQGAIGEAQGAIGEAQGEAIGEAQGEAQGEAIGEAQGEAIGEAQGAIGEAIGEAAQGAIGEAIGEAQGAIGEAHGAIGEEAQGEEVDSDDSMTTHAGGRVSPTTVLENESSSSSESL